MASKFDWLHEVVTANGYTGTTRTILPDSLVIGQDICVQWPEGNHTNHARGPLLEIISTVFIGDEDNEEV